MQSDQLWLQRVCLLFQLHYKQDTDAKLLFHLITQVASSNQFFLQKAAGWALRQLSKVNPKAVITFVNSSTLSNLTRKEALRLINKP
jgi:3-methyladenine DNA glycosylase AlkD